MGAHWSVVVVILLLTQLLATSVLPMLVPGAAPADYWIAGVAGGLGLIVSLLAHELAHAMTARRAGLSVTRITLWMLGGVSELAASPRKPETEVRVALAGPLTSLGLGVLLELAAIVAAPAGLVPLGCATLSWLASTNVVLGVFNLLPGTPLDGGRVLHGWWWRRTGDRERATRAASRAGQVLGALLAGSGLLMVLVGRWDGLWLALIGWFIAGSAAAEVDAGPEVPGSTLRAADVMAMPPQVVPATAEVGTVIDQLRTGVLRHRRYPVVSPDGDPIAVLTLSDVARWADHGHRQVPVGELARPIRRELIVSADTSVRALQPRRGELLVVQHDHHVVGVITDEDLTRAVEMDGVRWAADHPAG